MTTISDCNVISLPKIADPRGNLTFIEENQHLPFAIKRVYYLYEVPAGGVRGGHAHKNLDQLIVAINGSFTVVIDDGSESKEFTLTAADQGLYLPTMLWRHIKDFSCQACCLVLASDFFKPEDYIRDYAEFRLLKKGCENAKD